MTLAATVVIPFKNAAATIGETLQSLQSQTRRDFEIIFIDDGSSDSTAEMIHASQLRHATVLRSPAPGPAAARNAGIQRAAAAIVGFLDADDCWFPGAVEVQLGALDDDPSADLVFSDCLIGPEHSRAVLFSHNVHQPSHPTLVDLILHRPVPFSTVFARRRAFGSEAPFDTTLGQCEDYDLWYRIRAAGAVFRHTPLALAFIRVRSDGASADLIAYRRAMTRVLDRLLSLSELDSATRSAAALMLRGLETADYPDHERSWRARPAGGEGTSP